MQVRGKNGGGGEGARRGCSKKEDGPKSTRKDVGNYETYLLLVPAMIQNPPPPPPLLHSLVYNHPRRH